MVEVGAAAGPAGVAAARAVDRLRILAEPGVAQVDAVALGALDESPAVTGDPGRRHAVDGVDAEPDAGEDVAYPAQAEELPRTGGRHGRHAVSAHLRHLLPLGAPPA